MVISEKIKTIDKEIKQNKVQYNLDRHLRYQLYHQGMLVNMI